MHTQHIRDTRVDDRPKCHIGWASTNASILIPAFIVYLQIHLRHIDYLHVSATREFLATVDYHSLRTIQKQNILEYLIEYCARCMHNFVVVVVVVYCVSLLPLHCTHTNTHTFYIIRSCLACTCKILHGPYTYENREYIYFISCNNNMFP